MSFDMLSQVALILASVGLAGFCVTLARRLRRLNDLETGLGGAIAVMAAEVDRLEQAIGRAQAEATEASQVLADEIASARRERALWDLRQKLGVAATPEMPPAPARASVRRLRKRAEADHA